MKKITTLSKQTKAIWGKLSHDGSHTWLPLWMGSRFIGSANPRINGGDPTPIVPFIDKL